MIDVDALVEKIRGGDRRSLARAMSLVDGRGPDARALEDHLRPITGQVPWWGLTGPPGVGKSTLIDALLTRLRQADRRIGVVAVDPTSPRSNGALLGDRVRMMRHAVDRDVFIRSLATHHRDGGLSDATIHCARLLELAGYDPVLIETVGVGQNEVDVAAVADICVVVLGPGYGDDIQLIKAGLLETADLVVVNKCDLSEGRRLLAEVRAELSRGQVPEGRTTIAQGFSPGEGSPPNTLSPVGATETPAPSTQPGVIGIKAKSGRGVDDLLDTLLKLDRAAREPTRQQQCRHRRALDEIRRSAITSYADAVDRALASPRAKDLVKHLENGTSTLDHTIQELSTLARQLADPRTQTEPRP